MIKLSKWLETLGKLALLGPNSSPAQGTSKTSWLAQHHSFPPSGHTVLGGICKIFFTFFNSRRKSAYDS
jgi:hypothetical protein